MQNEHGDNAIDSARPQLLSYAGPRQADEESLTRPKRFLVGNRVTDAIVVTLIVLAVLGVLLPALTPRHRGYSTVVACSNNLRQVFAAMQNYCAEYGDAYPMHVADVAKYTGGSGRCFVCPASATKPSPGPTAAQLQADLRNPAKACCSYVLVVPGKRGSGLKANTIVLHELPGIHKSGVVNVAYADGGVRTLTPAEATWALSELKAGFNPPRPIGSAAALAPAANGPSQSTPTTAKS